ncbi:MAG: carboxymuconolactone decarboxylase family protein [Mesorhizobium sp.]|uniref:Carboxymuconolactone decarboxylase family protein n=1 Tax=Aquamicrobium soli TaxID=1811518 RepID=A0ABV7KID7_9HYPH
MAYINTRTDSDPDSATSRMFDRAMGGYGYLPNMVKAFSHRPEVMEAWNALLGSIKSGMDMRRYELVTMAAARELRSSYCMLAHGSVLLHGHFTAPELQAIVEDADNAPLDAKDRAIMRFAAKVVRDATSVTGQDVEALRAHHLSDAEIFDIVAAAAARCFFSKTLDGLGVEPDGAYHELEPKLKQALVVGRAIDTGHDMVRRG